MSAHQRRVSRLQDQLGPQHLGALLVTSAPNVRYLTGFTGSNGVAVVPAAGSPVLVTDARYTEQAEQECPGSRIEIDRETLPRAVALACEFANESSPTVGFESEHISYADWCSMSDESAPVRFQPTEGLVEALRRIKDDGEVEAISRACQIAQLALQSTLESIHVGVTEREIARNLDIAMWNGGAEDRAFDTIVAGGPNSAIPHHTPTDRPLERGDLLKIDFGARVAGYNSDITRTFVVGGAPSPEQLDWHAAVLAANQAARDLLAPGVHAGALYARARQALEDHGLAGAFVHGLGHGVGLEIHETPILTAQARQTLESGEVVTVEPGVYFAEVGGIRIEDTLVVTADGCRSLTTLPRELTQVG